MARRNKSTEPDHTEDDRDSDSNDASEGVSRINSLQGQLEEKAAAFGKLMNMPHFALLQMWSNMSIEFQTVDTVYCELRERFGDNGDELVVLLSSSGGDIHAAYNLAQLFRRYGRKRLVFVVPRWAKSAATLLVCGGDEILMTPVAELGPLDPQISELNIIERRMEQFSPLNIKATLELIAEQYRENKPELADALVEKLQYPITLGSHLKSLGVAKEYLDKLLKSRMLKAGPSRVPTIIETLVEGYPDHGACILCEEVTTMGVLARELEGDQLQVAWDIHLLEKKLAKAVKESVDEQKREGIKERIQPIAEDMESGGKQNSQAEKCDGAKGERLHEGASS